MGRKRGGPKCLRHRRTCNRHPKSTIEAKLIKMAAESPKGIFDYRIAYQLAREEVLKKLKGEEEKSTKD